MPLIPNFQKFPRKAQNGQVVLDGPYVDLFLYPTSRSRVHTTRAQAARPRNFMGEEILVSRKPTRFQREPAGGARPVCCSVLGKIKNVWKVNSKIRFTTAGYIHDPQFLLRESKSVTRQTVVRPHFFRPRTYCIRCCFRGRKTFGETKELFPEVIFSVVTGIERWWPRRSQT